jgi:hypothetical protein
VGAIHRILSDIQASFDESFYLQRYPDAASAVMRAACKDAWHHFAEQGFAEGRLWSATAPTMSGAGVLSRDPAIIHGWWWQDDPFRTLTAVSELLAEQPCQFLLSNAWSIVARYRYGAEFDAFLSAAEAYQRRFPQHAVTLLANDALEKGLLDWAGIDAIVFQHNGFYHSGAMRPASPRAVEFDAIYIARLHRYKRVHLMSDIPQACLVFEDVEHTYYAEIADRIRHVTFANGDPGGQPLRFLTSDQIAEWCARSTCGLCLSDIEGAMFASMEYLLCGLPIVTTRSLGGRGEYFDESFCLVSDSNPAAVAEAVRSITARPPDRTEVRESTLRKIRANRATLIGALAARSTGAEPGLRANGFEDLARDLGFKRTRTIASVVAAVGAPPPVAAASTWWPETRIRP